MSEYLRSNYNDLMLYKICDFIFIADIVQPPADMHIYTGSRLPMTAFEQIMLYETHGELNVCTLVSHLIWNV